MNLPSYSEEILLQVVTCRVSTPSFAGKPPVARDPDLARKRGRFGGRRRGGGVGIAGS